jgi:hypothetical protein
MPRLPEAGRFWHAKAVSVRSRQWPLIIDIPQDDGRDVQGN